MLPSQLFELADEARYNGFEDEDSQELTRLAYAIEFEDSTNAISVQSLDHNYVYARHMRNQYFG